MIYHIYDCFDDDKVAEKITDFKHKNITTVRFLIPDIHCSSCVFVLENLSRKHKSIIDVNVDFNSKQMWVTFNNTKLKISELAEILHDTGYPPSMDFEFMEKKNRDQYLFDRKLTAKLAISFFCFGNIMLLSIPEYVGAYNEDIWFFEHRNFFRYLMLVLSLPIIIYSSADHIKYAILGLKKQVLSMDVPISIGILVLFFWSCYEVFLDLGSGYFDSLASFSLFLVISKIFQNYTHNKILSFDKNYKSYYPVLITKIHKKDKREQKIFLSSIKKGDIIMIKNEEIIPVDSILIKGNAVLDNSFITGESHLVNKKKGNRIYAGSKQKGEAIYLKVIKDVDHSYLSLLWNKKKQHTKKLSYLNTLSNRFSQYFFTPIILIISILTGLYWYFINGDILKAFQSTFSVLIISCPCALAISTPLIFGSFIRYLSKKGFYVKDIYTMEKISAIKTLIFDKTGTITDPNKEKVFFIGEKIEYEEKKIIASLLRNSNHPISNRILSELSIKCFYPVKNFTEIIGKGIEGIVKNIPVKIGSPEYMGISIHDMKNKTITAISINKKFLGYFLFRNYYRSDMENIFKNMKNYKIIILSGDHNELEKRYLKSILPKTSDVFFSQSPEDKLAKVKILQEKGEKVMMIGDGINDCAALNQSEVGIAVSDNPTSFFPSCDAFLQSNCLDKLFLFLRISKISKKLVIVNFIISLFYNGIGLIFSISGNLNPLIAAVLMPLSSFSVIAFSIISTWLVSRRLLV
ncbi:heavy metal translocating P-type ATPase [Blattabacterium cuenoti]|uniref:heavy metal translocating P-type ATPase n=1 Tax=Blattabacterium cuenoti TaxID=1653831 RepID=UPI00163B9F1E|nr:HAD-IC family P-type ATPase [Blattabacterium cuenoti]